MKILAWLALFLAASAAVIAGTAYQAAGGLVVIVLLWLVRPQSLRWLP